MFQTLLGKLLSILQESSPSFRIYNIEGHSIGIVYEGAVVYCLDDYNYCNRCHAYYTCSFFCNRYDCYYLSSLIDDISYMLRKGDLIKRSWGNLCMICWSYERYTSHTGICSSCQNSDAALVYLRGFISADDDILSVVMLYLFPRHARQTNPVSEISQKFGIPVGSIRRFSRSGP